jgi:hypothetical protein
MADVLASLPAAAHLGADPGGVAEASHWQGPGSCEHLCAFACSSSYYAGHLQRRPAISRLVARHVMGSELNSKPSLCLGSLLQRSPVITSLVPRHVLRRVVNSNPSLCTNKCRPYALVGDDRRRHGRTSHRRRQPEAVRQGCWQVGTKVGRCRLTVSKPVLKAALGLALETRIS